MKKEKRKYEWNFIAKFYFCCIVIFVLLVAYILIYREVHKEEIIENLEGQDNQAIVENTIE